MRNRTGKQQQRQQGYVLVTRRLLGYIPLKVVVKRVADNRGQNVVRKRNNQQDRARANVLPPSSERTANATGEEDNVIWFNTPYIHAEDNYASTSYETAGEDDTQHSMEEAIATSQNSHTRFFRLSEKTALCCSDKKCKCSCVRSAPYCEHEVLLCEIATAIQALIDDSERTKEEKQENVENPCEELAICQAPPLPYIIEDCKTRHAVLLRGPFFLRRKVSNLNRQIHGTFIDAELEKRMVAKPAGPLWTLPWTKDDLRKNRKEKDLLDFAKLVQGYCAQQSAIVTGPSKIDEKQYRTLRKVHGQCENIPFGSDKFDKLHHELLKSNGKWSAMLKSQDEGSASADQCTRLDRHNKILDRFKFNSNLSHFDVLMRSKRLTERLDKALLPKDRICSICNNPLDPEKDMVLHRETLQYIHFRCICGIYKPKLEPKPTPKSS